MPRTPADDDPAALERFTAAQEGVHDRALAELRQGRKQSHWMWFVFPQLRGLGQSRTAWFYGIEDADEARRYLDHPLLGRRMPDLDLVTAAGPLRVFELLHDARPLLLDLGRPGGLDITRWSDRVQLIQGGYEGEWELPVLGAVSAPTAVLVRPDGSYDGGYGAHPELDRTVAAEARALLDAGRTDTLEIGEQGSRCGAPLTVLVESSVPPPRMIVFGAIDFAAAVADWHVVDVAAGKLKKRPGAPPPTLALAPNPDILATLSAPGAARPRLVVGFAAETDDLAAHAQAKRARKGCDWIVANDVRPETGNMGGDANEVLLVTAAGAEAWPRLPKSAVAARLAQRIAEALA